MNPEETPRTRFPQLSGRQSKIDSLKPPNKDYGHQDSLFGNSFQSKAYFVVHPEWLSENVSPPISKPLNRPPWPWEQPRYRVNVQVPSEQTQQGGTKEKSAEGQSVPQTPRTYEAPTCSLPRHTPYHLAQLSQPYGIYDPLTLKPLGTPFRRPDFYPLRY